MSNTDLNTILSSIKSKIFLSEIIGKDVQLTKKGREFTGNCPFHLEKTGSFFVNDEKGKYYCFGCGAHGDIVSYVMESKGHNFRQALEFLALEAGVKLPEKETFQKKDNTVQKIMEKCVDFFQKQLKSTPKVGEYCQKRGLDQQTLENFKIGYCPRNISEFFQNLISSGFKFLDIMKTSVFRDKIRSNFSDRLIFPVFDVNNNVIAFGGRSMLKEAQPKYINSAESVLFQKKDVLYGYNLASKNISKKNSSYVVVEGYMDVAIMHKFGFHTTVATMGTSFSSDHLLKLWRYCDEPIICFDGDQAGRKAMIRAAYIALEYISPGKTLRFCKIPKDHDPDSYLTENSQESMEKLLKNSVYLIDFLWDCYLLEHDLIETKTPEHTASWKKEIFKNLSVIKNQELQKMYTSEIKDRIYHLFRERRKSKFSKSEKLSSFYEADFEVNKKNNALLRESILLYTVFRYREIIPEVSEKLSCVAFSDQQMRELCDCLLCEKEIEGKFDQIIKSMSAMADRYCDFHSSESMEEMVCFWTDVFHHHVFKNAYNDDLKTAKKDLKKELNENAWERLKALKIGSFHKKK